MYVRSRTLGGLGLSLKPPQWLRNLGARILSATQVSVPTPAGAVVVDLGNPAQLDQLRRSITGARVQVGQTQPTAFDQASSAIERNVPGGWGGLALAGAALGALLLLRRRK